MKSDKILSLHSTDSKKKTVVGERQKNIKVFYIFLILGVFLLLFGKPTLNTVGGITILLFGISFIISGAYQLIGVGECECPYCGEKGYIAYSSRKYKCKACKKTSEVVIETDK